MSPVPGGTFRQLELVVLDEPDAGRVVLVADVAFERRRFAKMHAPFERAGRRLDGLAGRDDLDAIHRDFRRNLLVERLADGGSRGYHQAEARASHPCAPRALVTDDLPVSVVVHLLAEVVDIPG